MEGNGTVDLDMVSLFPEDTRKGRPGGMRADPGHPKPFTLTFLGVGNENRGPQYIERLAVFQKAIKAKYPDIKKNQCGRR